MFAKNEYKILTVFYVLFVCCILSSNVSATLFSIANVIAGSSGPRANYEMSPPPKPTLGKMIGDKIDGIRNFKAMVFGPLLNLASVLLTKGEGSSGTSSKAPAPSSSGESEKGKTTEKGPPPPYVGGGPPADYGGGGAAYYGGGGRPTPGYYGGAPSPTYYGGGDGYFGREAFPTYNGEGKMGYYNLGGPPPPARYNMHSNANSKSGVFVHNHLSDKYQYDISHPANSY